MKIAIYNDFFGKQVAETELSKRICLAAKNLGWEAIEFCSSIEINKFNPDFVIACTLTPKLTGFPTYGCMWNPIYFIEQYDIRNKHDPAKKNILSYDGYLSSSPQINNWLEDILFGTNKKSFILPFYTSCHQNTYQPPCLENPHLVYVGTNWDGPRFHDLFTALDAKSYMEIYGPENAWTYLKQSYKSSLPFDGVSVLNTLNKAGVGLCLHREEHRQAAIPSMRIFETVASGAIAICEEHPFIQEAFGDSVFYIHPDLNTSEKVLQISKYMQWIQNNQQEALAMSAEAHKIFTEKYSFENLLLGIVPHHQKLIREKGFISTDAITEVKYKPVEIIVRVSDRNAHLVKRCLDSIASQSYPNIRVIIVKYQESEDLKSLLKAYEEKFSIKIINVENSGFRSTQIAAGINAVDAEYFAILDENDLIYPNHIYSLVSLLEKHNEIGVAYSGYIRVRELDEKNSEQNHQQGLSQEVALSYFEPFDINKILFFDSSIASKSFVIRKSVIDENLKQDPRLKVAEDMFLLLNLCRNTKFIFSYEASCELSGRSFQQANSTIEDEKLWEESFDRLKLMFWKKDFPVSQNAVLPIDLNFKIYKQELEELKLKVEELNLNKEELRLKVGELNLKKEELRLKVGELNSKTERLDIKIEHYQNIISAVKTSKFWKLRTLWLRAKKALGMPTEDQII